MLKKIIKNDKDGQIVLLPYFFRNSLGDKARDISDDLVIDLGMANLLGWLAYTIYDDFLDEEGEPVLLSVANICLREMSEIFNKVISLKSGFSLFARKILDEIDGANTWETAHCRFDVKKKIDKIHNFGNLSQLAEKSLGHALGPIAVLFALGYRENSFEVRGLMNFFKHYIIARQLDDDAHDWKDDLKRGQINAAGAKVLRDFGRKKLDFNKLEKVFWDKTIIGVCNVILRHISLAEKTLDKLSIVQDKQILINLLIPHRLSAQKAIKEQKNSLDFVRNYK
jgi:hypothetical protein